MAAADAAGGGASVDARQLVFVRFRATLYRGDRDREIGGEHILIDVPGEPLERFAGGRRKVADARHGEGEQPPELDHVDMRADHTLLAARCQELAEQRAGGAEGGAVLMRQLLEDPLDGRLAGIRLWGGFDGLRCLGIGLLRRCGVVKDGHRGIARIGARRQR